MRADSFRLHYGWIILAMGTLSVFGALGLARFGYTMLLPAMQAGLGMDNAQAGLLATANLAGYLVMALIGGVLTARYGARLAVGVGLAMAGLGMVLTGLSRGFFGAILWRLVTGLGSGMGNMAVMGMLAAWFSARRRGLASGIGVAGSSLALIFAGPFVPRVLSTYSEYGWRTCWLVFGGLTLLLAVGAFLILRDKPADLGLRPVAVRDGDVEAVGGREVPAWGDVYRSARLWFLGLVYAAFGFSYIIYMTFFTKGLIVDMGYSPGAAGRLFMIMGWFSLFCGLIWGTVSDAIGRRWTLVLVYLFHTLAFSLFALSPTAAGVTISAILFGLTAWSIPAIMAAACGDMLGPRMAPAGLGLITLLFGFGQAAGPSLAGAVADATGSFSPAFLLAGVAALFGAMGAALVKVEPMAHRR